MSYSHARTYHIINFLQIIGKLWTEHFNAMTVILCVCVHSSCLDSLLHHTENPSTECIGSDFRLQGIL